MDSNSFNFVKLLPVEMTESIFNLIPLQDLLTASLVHTSWNDFIGSTRRFTKNFKLLLDGTTIKPCSPEEVVKILQQSTRQYKHLEFTRMYSENISELFDVVALRDWESFRLRCNFQEKTGMMLMDKLTEHCTTLTSIDLHFTWLYKAADLLTNKKNLKEIKLVGRIDINILDQLHELKLTEFSLTSYSDVPHGFNASFNSFLQTQCASLNCMSLDFNGFESVLDESSLAIILSMPQLKDLTICPRSRLYKHDKDSSNTFPNNYSIEKLKIIFYRSNIDISLQSASKCFLSKMRHLKTLQCSYIKQDMFETITQLDSLQEILVDDCIWMTSDTSDRNSFPNLQSVKFGVAVKPSLQLQGPHEQKRFSRCLFNELQNHPDNEQVFTLYCEKHVLNAPII